MRINGAYGSVIQGVSQQPARDRLPGQCTEQINYRSDPVTSLRRRPATAYVQPLFAGGFSNWRWCTFTSGQDGELYFLATSAGALRLFNAAGEPQMVTAEASFAYLSGAQVALESTGEAVYVADTAVQTAMLPDTEQAYTEGSLVFLLGGQYGRVFRITVAEPAWTASYTVPDGSVSSHSTQVTTEYIATQLANTLTASAPSGYTVTRHSDVLWLRGPDGTGTLNVTVDDGDGGVNIIAVNAKTTDTGRLPRVAPHGYTVKISGNGAADADDWWLQFRVDDKVDGAVFGEGFGKDGVWRECAAPGVKVKLDPSTMPHELVQTDTGWVWRQADWKARAAGNNESNPEPSFVGKPINALGTFQSRLVFAAGNAVFMSRTNKPTALWKQSATVLADTDPIDIESTAATYAEMQRLVPFNRDLVVFSERAQFVVLGRNALTPKNAALVLTSSFESDLRASPKAAGRAIFFAFRAGAFTGVREFYSDGAQDVNDSYPVTQHVSRYLLGGVRSMAGTSNFDVLFVLTDADARTVYTYEYLWDRQERVQSSWSKWVFPWDIAHLWIDENRVHVIAHQAGTFHLLLLDLTQQNTAGLTFPVTLDGWVQAEYSGTPVPYPLAAQAEELLVVQGAGCTHPGLTARFVLEAGAVRITEDVGTGTVHIGQRFLSRYVPTPPLIKDRNGEVIGTGRLTISRFLVQYGEAGYIRTVVSTPYTSPVQVEYEGRTVSAVTNRVGEQPVTDGTLQVPFRHESTMGELAIETDRHTQLVLRELEYEGQWRTRGARIGG